MKHNMRPDEDGVFRHWSAGRIRDGLRWPLLARWANRMKAAGARDSLPFARDRLRGVEDPVCL